MRSLVAGVGVLFLAGCASHPPQSYRYQDYPGKTKPSVTSQENARKGSSMVASSNTVSIPVSSNTVVGVVSPTNSLTVVVPRSVAKNVVRIPATPAVTNVAALTTNRAEGVASAAADLVESELVNGVQRRAHLRFKEKATEENFLNIAAKKQAVFEDMRVIGKLYQEKNNQQQQFAASLQEQFAVKPDGNYQYDADAMAITEIVKPASGSDSAKTQLHMKFKDASTAQTFVRLATARRVSMEEMASLQLMYREKQMEIAEYDRQLADAYAIVKDRNYQYDPTTKTLYELVKLPEGVEAPKASGVVPTK